MSKKTMLEKVREILQSAWAAWQEVYMPVSWTRRERDLQQLIPILKEFALSDTPITKQVVLCRQALELVKQEDDPKLWAILQIGLANNLSEITQDDRAENLEQAIHHYLRALQVYTNRDFRRDWARTQLQLALAYNKRIYGNHAENLEKAIHHYHQALEVFTQEDFPEEWATAQNDLALAYRMRVGGDLADNIDLAIHHHRKALEVQTREAFPLDWARTEHNLGIDYRKRIHGERAENLELAIDHCLLALEIRTREAFPQEWARSQTNLATAYGDRIRGKRAENLELAIHHYNQALKVLTREAFPEDRAFTQNNLATAYIERIHGERAENLERAIHHSQQALKVFTRESFPQEWATTQANLAVAYSDTIRGFHRVENLNPAIHHYHQALTVCQPTAFPKQCRWIASGLGRLSDETENWAEAARAYQQALAADEILFQFALDRVNKESQLTQTGNLYRRAALALARSDNAAAAVETLEKGRARLLRDHLERNRRDLEQLSELGYEHLYQRYLDANNVFRNLLHQSRNATDSATEHIGLRPDIQMQLEQTQEEIQAIIKEIQTVPGYKSFMQSLTTREVQAVAASAPLVYLLTHKTGSLALLVTPEKVEALWPELNQKSLGDLLLERDGETISGGYLPGQLIGGEEARTWLADSLQELLPRLGSDLLAPVAKRLRELDASSVVLIPTGRLGLLPLHAVQYEHDGRTHYLQDEFAVSYAPSAQALTATHRWLQRQDEQELPLLAGVGNPWPQPPPTHSLAFARAELEDIAALFGDRSRPLYEEEATKDALLDEAVPGADYIHLSCHGLFDLENPLQSQLLLAEGTPLTLQEILDEAPFAGARLVVLSACQTGIAEFKRLPDEVVGWPAGVLQAEVPGVVGTLWPVNDLSTALLMTKFYEYHLRGDPELGDGPLPPAKALCRAQGWLREVTAGELTDYFDRYRLKHKKQRDLASSRMPEEVAAQGALLFGIEEEQARPFSDKPYQWAPFIFMGV